MWTSSILSWSFKYPKYMGSKFFHREYSENGEVTGCMLGTKEDPINVFWLRNTEIGKYYNQLYRSGYFFIHILFPADGQNIHIHFLLPANLLAFLGTDYILFFEGGRVSSHDSTTFTTLVYGTSSNSKNVNYSFSSAPFFSVKCWKDFTLIITIFWSST